MAWKYSDEYAGIRAFLAAEAAAGHQHDPLPPYDFGILADRTLADRLKSWVFPLVFRAVFALVRAIPGLRPLLARFLKLAVIASADDVRQVLKQGAEFETPFALEMADLAGGKNFVLGLAGDAHDRQRRIIQAAIRPGDLAALRADARHFAAGLIENADGRIDVMSDFFTRVATESCFRYFGFRAVNAGDFASWSLGISNLLFADPQGSPVNRALGRNAAARMRLVIDDAIARSFLNPDDWSPTNTVRSHLDATILDRLVNQSRLPDGPDRAEIRAMLVGLVAGFIPTISLGAGKIMDEMLRWPDALIEAQACAAKNDDAGLTRVLMELARLNPALAPGQWRYCTADTTVSGFTIKRGMTLAVGTASALRDPALYPDPDNYNAARQAGSPDPQFPDADLVFGMGMHDCIGRHVATTVLTAMFAELLKQPGLRRANGKAGKLQSIGPFPTRLTLEFDTPATEKTMFLVIIATAAGVEKSRVDAAIASLGNPATADMAGHLDATNIVHFASMATIAAGDALYLAIELTVDGAAESALRAIATPCDTQFRHVLDAAGVAPGDDLAAFLIAHIVRIHAKPWGPTGLNFQGLPGMSVRRIQRDQSLAETARTLLDDHLHRYVGQGTRAMRVLTQVRRAIMQDQYFPLKPYPVRQAAMDTAARQQLDAYSLIPAGTALNTAAFRQPTRWGAFRHFLFGGDGLIFTIPIIILFALFSLGLWKIIAPTAANIGWGLTGSLLGGALATALALIGIGLALYAILRAHEKRDIPDNSSASIDHMRAIAAVEDHAGISQNHILAIGTLKPGVFRKLTHAFALWGIAMVCKYYFRPGMIINMGTIHAARWWRLPGTDKVAFYSNYDGSWDSYLEDFITRAAQGQTASWGNWQGFPRSAGLIGKGAKDGDRFKRWVRTQQQPAPFWYSRFRDLTTDQIRSNALIHHGLAQANGDAEARDWLRLFGSRPRLENGIESDEVQSLVFEGLKRLPASTCLRISLPTSRANLWRWQSVMLGVDRWTDDAGALAAVPGVQGNSSRLDPEFRISFGDKYAGIAPRDKTPNSQPDHAIYLALSARGIARYRDALLQPSETGGPAWHIPELFDSFPMSFRLGMAGRAKILGDTMPLHWSDTAANSVDAVLLLYGRDDAALAAAIAVHTGLITSLGGAVLGETRTYYSENEHFGYRDGISQPVIRGTGRFASGVPARDVVEPGEFILGYASNQGYLPLSPLVRSEIDLDFTLPVPDIGILTRFPDFGSFDSANAPRDFGRNGSYLVIRELEQDVAGFQAAMEAEARRLNTATGSPSQTQQYQGLDQVIGQQIDATWVKAKLMGRWPEDGRPLVGHPLYNSVATTGPHGQPFNDFSYGQDDPLGLACPFGAHIRRANPRDSKQPGDADEQAITNRHRLLRRGRNYGAVDGSGEKGMVFMGLCTDIERQFEFLQQTWLNAPTFHGLEQEPDPFVGQVDASLGPRCFTIPTAAGPVRLQGLNSYVTPRAGGYFFLPGRSALLFLERLLR